MSTIHNPIKLYETVVDDCPYLSERRSASIIVDPEHQINTHLFSLLSRSGFRRSGELMYSPRCPNCSACISVRIPVDRFAPSRSQKRVARRNSDLLIKQEPMRFEQAHFDLYLRYQQARHTDSSMSDPDPQKYEKFIASSYSNSSFLCMYHEKQLIAVSVIDHFEEGISAVYTFFEPESASRSLGTFAILKLVEFAQAQGVPYLYLGYWIKESQKMDYKKHFKPIEGYINKQWMELSL